MKFIIILSLFLSTSFIACQENHDSYEIFPINNNELPTKKSLKNRELKILFIGSSWMKNTYFLCNKVFQNSGIKTIIGGMYGSGIELKSLVKTYENDYTMEFSYSRQGEDWIVSQRTLKDAIKYENWDIIVFQQSAKSSFHWDTYQPFLNKFRDILLSNATNKNVCLALNQTWAPAKGGYYIKNFGFDSQMDMYLASLNAYKKAMEQSGIHIVIPSGTAVYFLRNTELENDMDLTYDALHLDPGVGQYLTACTVFMALAYPIFGESIKGNSFRTNAGTPVTDYNSTIIQDCAIKAYKNPFYLLDGKK